MRDAAREHVDGLFLLYGEAAGTRIARKHLGWYAEQAGSDRALRDRVVRLETAREQLAAVEEIFAGAGRPARREERLAA